MDACETAAAGAGLRGHQLVMLEMLDEVDRICRSHNIRYQLFAGTALGAVRHRGFIPWDDDLDIIMLRPDYERFLRAAPGELNADIYYLQAEFSEHWPMCFSKLRKNNTACIERYRPRDPQTHQGVYIDIFPCDNLSDSRAVRAAQFLASRAVIAKLLDRRGYLTDSRVKKLFMVLCRALPLRPLARLVRLGGGGDSRMVHCFFGAASRYKSSVFPRAWLTETVPARFEDGVYPLSAHYRRLLTALYGDYMTPTPESERGCKKHCELLDLERSYEEYTEAQKAMRFREYTKCIR